MPIGDGLISEGFAFQPLNHASLVIDGDSAYDPQFALRKPDGRYALSFDNFVQSLPGGGVESLVTFGKRRCAFGCELAQFSPARLGQHVPHDRRHKLFSALELTRDPNDLRRFYLDVSRWAGQSVSLSFSSGYDIVAIDSIAFVVPEPRTWASFGLGAAFMMIAAGRGWISVRKGTR